MQKVFTKRELRHKRVRGKMQGTGEVPRLVVFRSNKHIYCQVIDDSIGNTLLGTSDLRLTNSTKKEKGKGKIETATLVGSELAKTALSKKIKQVVFDRNGYRYHGRVKALAEGARAGGLIF